MAKRLTDNHPTKQKFDKLCALAEELGIEIIFRGHRTVVCDTGSDEYYDLEDSEDSSTLAELPPKFEYKLVEGR